MAAPVPASEPPKLVDPPKVAAVLPLLSRWKSLAVSARLKTWSWPCACAGVLDSKAATLLESSPAAVQQHLSSRMECAASHGSAMYSILSAFYMCADTRQLRQWSCWKHRSWDLMIASASSASSSWSGLL